MSSRVTAVLFDFDMTLIDSSYAITECTNLLAKAKGQRLVTREEVLAVIGLPIEKSWETLWGQGVVEPDWVQYYREHLRGAEFVNYRLFPGSMEVPKVLKEAGLLVGVVSNRRFARLAVEGVGMAPMMDVIVGLEDVQHPKPDPESVQVGISKLGISADSVLYVGDTDIDMRTACAAGVRGIGVTTGNFDRAKLLDAGAHRVCDDLYEVVDLVKEYNA